MPSFLNFSFSEDGKSKTFFGVKISYQQMFVLIHFKKIATFCAMTIFTDPLLQLSLDDSRNILYACTEKGTIQVCLMMQSFQCMDLQYWILWRIPYPLNK